MVFRNIKYFVFIAITLVWGFSGRLQGQATLLLEEPYSYDGTFAGTGHTAVYLSRVCAETPTELRRCRSGETGVVISRYHHIGGRDWIAVPLIPYLYAVKDPGAVPLYVDEKLVQFLRDEYLSNNLADVAGELGPKEPSNQLAGSAYDRTLYAFRIATSAEQDDELIRILNSAPNEEAYKLLNRNCADFVKQIINFYYPHATHRSVVGDLGVTTPKQVAKSLLHTAKHHPEMQMTVFVIPQVPGLKRSKPVHGVVESVVLAKKYVTPVLLFHPLLVGGVEAAYWAGWRFDPTKNAMVFDSTISESTISNSAMSDPWQRRDPPLTKEQRRSYLDSVSSLKRDIRQESVPGWKEFQANADPQLDAEGRPFLQADWNGSNVQIGLSRENALRLAAPPELVQDMLLTRIEQELKAKPARVSKRQVEADWRLLEQALDERKAELRETR
jgi:hypothetical protein